MGRPIKESKRTGKLDELALDFHAEPSKPELGLVFLFAERQRLLIHKSIEAC